MKRKSLGFKLTLGGIVIVLVPLMIVGIFSIVKVSETLENLSKERAAELAENFSDIIQATILGELKLTRDFAVGNATKRAAAAVADRGAENAADEIKDLNMKLANAMKELGGYYETIVVGDVNGVAFADSHGGKFKGASAGDREYFQIAKSGKANAGRALISRLSGKPMIPICAPIYSETGEFLGAVLTMLKLDFFCERIISAKIGKTGYPYILDQTGLCIAHPDPNIVFKVDINTLEGMKGISKKIAEKASGVQSYTFRGVKKIAGYAPVKLNGWYVVVTQNKDEFMETPRIIRDMILIVATVSLILTVIAVLIFARRISGPIMRVAEGLTDSASQIAAAASEISSGGQLLAQNASEQAASVQETSATLEQIAASGRKTSHLTQGASKLMNENIEKSAQSLKSLIELTLKMSHIESNSSQIGQLIKNINDIAFQTNLLALNAAIEAARAGEAGAGFSVVAGEVRNLSMRTAGAAEDTQKLLDTIITQVIEAAHAIKDINDDFEGIIESATIMGEKTAAITSASEDQAEGLEQISKASYELEQVSQNMAASAEESASAAEELLAQAEAMKAFVNNLLSIVGKN
jgi:methyl-accepting chemotaxis protein